MTRTIICLLGAALLAGCNSAPKKMELRAAPHPNGYTYQPELSLANNIMHAAGYTAIRDVEIPDRDNTIAGPSALAGLTDVAISSYTNFYGLGGLGSGLVGMFLAPSKTPLQEEFNAAIGWIPEKAVPTQSTPMQSWLDAGNNAVWTALEKWHPQAELRATLGRPNAAGDNWKSIRLWEPGCQNCKPYAGFIFNPRHYHEVVKPTPTPTFVKQQFGRSYPVAAGLGFSLPRKQLPTLEFYQDMSSEMPDWSYIYLAAGKYAVNIDGKLVRSTAPVILHKGTIFPFVTPVAGVAATE